MASAWLAWLAFGWLAVCIGEAVSIPQQQSDDGAGFEERDEGRHHHRDRDEF